MIFRRKKKQNERKKHKIKLKETLSLVQESKLFLMQQIRKIESMNLSQEEKELQLNLIKRSLANEGEKIKELKSRIGENNADNG